MEFDVGDARVTIANGPGWLASFEGSIGDHVGKPGIHVKGAYPVQYSSQLIAWKLTPVVVFECRKSGMIEVSEREPMRRSVTYPDGHVEHSVLSAIAYYSDSDILVAQYDDDSYWLFMAGYFGEITVKDSGELNAA